MSAPASFRFVGLIASLAEAGRVVRNTLNWRLIRGLGHLQILTRGSYLLLILVPVLAATWPAVHLVVNRHNQAVAQAAELLRVSQGDVRTAIEDARREVARLATPVPPSLTKGTQPTQPADARADALLSRLEAATDRMGQVAQTYTTDYVTHALTSVKLPWTLAAAFFAALFVALGHLGYQTMAPEAIRDATWEGFVLARKDDYGKHPSDVALKRARTYLKTREGVRVEASAQFEEERQVADLLLHTHEERLAMLARLSTQRLRSLLEWVDSGQSSAPADFLKYIRPLIQELLPAIPMDAAREDNMALVERGGRAEYLYLAGRNPAGIALTALLYSAGLWIIVLVIRAQATAVVTAAEWQSMRDLFWP